MQRCSRPCCPARNAAASTGRAATSGSDSTGSSCRCAGSAARRCCASSIDLKLRLHDGLIDRPENAPPFRIEHLDAYTIAELEERRHGLADLELLERPSL